MSNKRKRKRRLLSATTIVKAAARNVIGSPKPSTSMGGGSREVVPPRPAEYSGVLEREQTEEYISMSDRREERIPGAPGLAKSPTVARAPLNPLWKGSGGRSGDTFSYSKEVINHADFLRRTQGDAAANTYLDQIKSKGADVNPQHTNPQHTTGAVFGGGSIETALKEAEDKVTHHSQQLEIHQAEVTRWSAIRNKIKEVFEMATSPADRRGSERRTKAGSGRSGLWESRIVQVFRENGNHPLSKVELRKVLHKLSPEVNMTSIYGPIALATQRGLLQEDGDKLKLHPSKMADEDQEKAS